MRRPSCYVLAAALLLVYGQLLGPPNGAEARFCGKKLVTLVVKICNGCVYGGTSHIKRSSLLVDVEAELKSTEVSSAEQRLISEEAGSSSGSSDERRHTTSDPDPDLNSIPVPESRPEPKVRISSLEDLNSALGAPVKRSIVDECCHKTCSYSHLKKYCCT